MNEENPVAERIARMEFLNALNKVQGLLEPVTKDKENPHFKSGYASLAAVNETIMGPLSEAGFVLLSGGVDINGKTYLRTTLHHVKGHSESFDYPLICTDSNPQHLASATTYARRYALCAFFNLSTEDDDGNNATGGAKTVSREPASYTAKKEADRAAVTQSSEIEVVKFVPARVQFVEGKGKGAGKTFSEIFDPKGNKYGGDEIQGQMATSAMDNQKEIAVAFKSNGIYRNISRGGVKLAEQVPDSEDFHAIPF